ncbi:MAG: hypothetical protein Q8S00_23670 [Deltaproteobacteria bacterium]|nr:hypothetical protein [Deltaproteobacteria bacterium]MDZ4343332.1 hypothetical protein [Candidatus Binatia bacterium]
MWSDASHVYGRHDPLWFAEIVPAHAGHIDDSKMLGAKRQHLMGKI